MLLSQSIVYLTSLLFKTGLSSFSGSLQYTDLLRDERKFYHLLKVQIISESKKIEDSKCHDIAT